VFARRYFQALYARLKPPFAVVFDGYHEVPASSALHEVMRIALGELPRGGCALIVSRGDPPGALARLRANRALSVLGWEELRLTRDETARIALERDAGLEQDAVEELYARTQGWAAGLVLVLEQARRGALAAAPDPSTSQVVFDYLAGEIFQKTDAATQDFLLRTACLPQTSASMAAALTGEERAAEILAGLHRDNFFVTLRPAQPEALYQYHPMFREFLLARALEALPKELRRQLQRSAAALREAAGFVDDALLLYRDSHDWDDMARLIATQGEAMLAQGRGETLRHWVEDLPPELLHRYPWAVYWAAASQAQIAPREARLQYERAFELFRALGAEGAQGTILAASGAMDAILYELDDLSLLDRWIAVLDQAAQEARFASPTVEARVACSMVFALTLRQPQRRDIEQWVTRALGAARHDPDPNLHIFVGSLCALTLMWTGLDSRARQLLDAAQRAAAAPGVSPFSRITLLNVESMHGMLTAQYAPALEAMREGLEIAKNTGVHTWTFQLLVHGYGAALGAGDLATAARLAKELDAQGSSGAGRLSLCFLHHFQAWEAMLRKDLMRALQMEKSALRMAVEVGCPYFETLCRLALAQVLLECGDQRKCIAQLQRMRAIAREIPNRHLEYACLLGFADMALAHGRPRPGLKALRLGLEIGRQYGYEHFLWWWP
jgi:ATP/maltotriose-dependent transcriptional regulator MalT